MGRARRRVSAYPMDTTPLARGIQVVRQPSLLERSQGYEKNRRKHTPDPFEKGRARRRVSAYPMECSMNAQLIASRLHVVYKWCARLPLLRGARGMNKAEPHTPDPFEKGRARRRVSAYPMDTTLLTLSIQVVRQPSPLERGQGYERSRSRIPPTPLKRGGRGGGSVLTQWGPPYLHVEYKWCASLPLLRGARGMKKTEENIPSTPLKRGGRGSGSVLTQWGPPYLHVEYKRCGSLPLTRGDVLTHHFCSS